jgi:hypothetical protein
VSAAALVLCAASSLAFAQAPPPIDKPAMAQRVKDEMLHAWRGYEKYAWGHDELKPVSRAPHDWYASTLLMTPVDALDTLVLMGLTDEAEKARTLIVERLSFDKDVEVKSFEITIRLLGGLLSAHQLTGDPKLLRLADDLGARLLPTFDTPTGMPYMYVNLRTGKTREARSNPAEIGTLILEFGTLSRLTGKPVYFEKAKRALTELGEARSSIGLVGDEIDVRTGKWLSRTSHVGGGIDSYYEYLLKCGILFDDAQCMNAFADAKRALDAYLADEILRRSLVRRGNMDTGKRTATTFGALHAFLPAVFALSGDAGRAGRLEDSCFEMWTRNGNRAGPLRLPGAQGSSTPPTRCARRSSSPRSSSTARRTTRSTWRWAARFFDDLVARCRVADGYTVLESVTTMKKGDLMPELLPRRDAEVPVPALRAGGDAEPDAVVFNTEAHPLRPRAGGRRRRMRTRVRLARRLAIAALALAGCRAHGRKGEGEVAARAPRPRSG